MALEGAPRFTSYERSRNLIYVSSKVADDSAFPFESGDELVIRITGKRLVVEKGKGQR